MQHIWNEITEKLRKFVHDAGFKKVVVGASGGIDSSLVACLAASALGKDNVLLVMMPSPYSSMGSVEDTRLLAIDWQLQTVTMPITKLMASFGNTLAPVAHTVRIHSDLPRNMESFADENIQARIRMVLLMAISNEYGYLVLNTCNKSEDYTGYATLYGDSCGAIAPIGDLYKTEVYILAHWINGNHKLPNIPEAILTKAPSAELNDGQLDTDSLPPYDVLDPILRLHVDLGASLEVFADQESDLDTVRHIIKLVEGSAYKRAQSSPVLKLDRGDQ